MSFWPHKKLGTLTSKIGSGATPRGGAATYIDSGTTLIRSQNILDHEMKITEIAHISDEAAHKLRGVTVESNDVLINITGDSIARCSVVNDVVLPARVNQHVSILRTTPELDARFLQKFLVTPTSKDHLISISSGGTRKALTKTDLSNLDVPVPPIKVQRSIAKVIGALDDKIAANTKLAVTADELAAALSSQAFAAGQGVPLTEIAEITMGSSPVGTSLNDNGEGIVFYQGIRDFGLRYPEQRIWTNAPVRLALELDTLLSVRAPVGSANIAPDDLCIGRGLASIRSRFGTPYTLFHAIRSSSIWHQFNAEGTVFGSINRKQLESIRLSWINSKDLQEHEATLTSLEHVIRTAFSTIRKLAATRDALLPQLMSGKLRVKDAEEFVAASI